jgi:hypothetical protein
MPVLRTTGDRPYAGWVMPQNDTRASETPRGELARVASDVEKVLELLGHAYHDGWALLSYDYDAAYEALVDAVDLLHRLEAQADQFSSPVARPAIPTEFSTDPTTLGRGTR